VALATAYPDLTQAIDRLKPNQVDALRVIVDGMLHGQRAETPAPRASEPHAAKRPHRFGFAAVGSGPADLASNADAYLAQDEYS